MAHVSKYAPKLKNAQDKVNICKRIAKIKGYGGVGTRFRFLHFNNIIGLTATQWQPRSLVFTHTHLRTTLYLVIFKFTLCMCKG